MYADDTQLYIAFNVEEYTDAKSRLEECMIEIKQWMKANHLKLNESKTEFLVIGKQKISNQIEGVSSIFIEDTKVDAVSSAKNIGAVLDNQLDMVQHVNNICRSCYIQLRQIGQIRAYISQEATATMVNSLITSRLDYLNSLLYGLPDYLLSRLQLVQNNAARLVLRKRKHDHATPLLKALHWLPVSQRIEFKINMLTFKSLNGLAPGYLSCLLAKYEPTRPLRSSSKNLLKEKKSKLKRAGDRSFSVCAPKLWNRLPDKVTQSETLETFKVALKTHLFRIAFE